MPAVIIRQRKAIRRKNGVFIYFEGIEHDLQDTHCYVVRCIRLLSCF